MVETRRAPSGGHGKVAVLMGGDSAEREISLLGGKAVLKALNEEGVNAVGVDMGDDLIGDLAWQDIERIFIMLHGKKGEDGKVQAALELNRIPYTGSGVLACALAMDKIRCKKIWRADNLPTPPFEVMDEATDWPGVIARLGTVFVKPVREGSSIGITKAATGDELMKAYAQARKFDSLVIAEQGIEGVEFSVTILGERALPVVELKPAAEFYDFHAKYESAKTGYVCPARLSADKTSELQEMALEAYRSIGCRGWGRVDVMQDRKGAFWLLEVNTVPGMTSHSLVPMAAKAAGMSFNELVVEILSSSYVDRNED